MTQLATYGGWREKDMTEEEKWLEAVPETIRYLWVFSGLGSMCGILALVLVLVG